MSVQSQNVSQLIKDCKRRARVLLDTDHNRLWLILALGLWLATAGFTYMLGGALVYAANDSVFTEQPSVLATVLLIASYTLMLLLAFLLLVPMSGGVIHVSEQIYKGERVQGRDLFYAFGSFGRYVRCMRAGLRSLGKKRYEKRSRPFLRISFPFTPDYAPQLNERIRRFLYGGRNKRRYRKTYL